MVERHYSCGGGCGGGGDGEVYEFCEKFGFGVLSLFEIDLSHFEILSFVTI